MRWRSQASYLDTRSNGFQYGSCGDPNTFCTVFGDDATLSRFDIIIVNSGAHWKPAAKYGPAMEVASERIETAMRRLHGEKAILIARNTPPGHGQCSSRCMRVCLTFSELRVHEISCVNAQSNFHLMSSLIAFVSLSFLKHFSPAPRRMFDGPVSLDIALHLISNSPKRYK